MIRPAASTTQPAPALVWARAAALAPVVLLAGVVSHVSADGLLPGAAVMSLLLVGLVLLAVPLLRVRASVPRLLALLVGGQTVTHLVLSVSAGHVGQTSAAGSSVGSSPGTAVPATPLAETVAGGRRVGSLAEQYDAGTVVTAGGSGLDVSWVGHLWEHLVATGPLMALAHVAGAAALALWLSLGEEALWHLLCLGATGLVAALAGLRVQQAVGSTLRGSVAAAGRLAHHRAPAPLLTDVLHHPVVSHRGPPASLLAA